MSAEALNNCFEDGWEIVQARFNNDRGDLAYTTVCNKITVLMREDMELREVELHY